MNKERYVVQDLLQSEKQTGNDSGLAYLYITVSGLELASGTDHASRKALSQALKHIKLYNPWQTKIQALI